MKTETAESASPDLASPELSSQSQAHPRYVERIPLQLEDGTVQTAVLSFPVKIQLRLPVVIVLGGFETGERAMGFLKKDLNAIYATADYPYKAPRQRSFVDSLGQIAAIRRAVRRTDLIVDALIDRLQSDPRVDTDKITFVGASFGAPFAITAAIRNPEIDAVLLIHAFGRGDLVIARQLANAWGEWSCPFAWLLGKVAWALLDYSAPELDVLDLRPHQYVLFTYSDADEQLPDQSTESLREGLTRSPAKVTVHKTDGGHIAPDKKTMLNELMDFSLAWLKKRNLL